MKINKEQCMFNIIFIEYDIEPLCFWFLLIYSQLKRALRIPVPSCEHRDSGGRWRWSNPHRWTAPFPIQTIVCLFFRSPHYWRSIPENE